MYQLLNEGCTLGFKWGARDARPSNEIGRPLHHPKSANALCYDCTTYTKVKGKLWIQSGGAKDALPY